MEHLMNKTLDEIKTAYNECMQDEDDIREMIRLRLSRILMDNGQDNPMECEIALETDDCCGMSSLLMPWVTKMWQDECEGLIYFEIDGKGWPKEFDDMTTEELMIIIEGCE